MVHRSLLYVVIPIALVASCILSPTTVAISLVLVAILATPRLFLPSVSKGVVGFFHPHAEDGGGGERVLWCAIVALQSSRPDWKVAVFTADGYGTEALSARAKRNFDLDVSEGVRVIPLLGVRRLDPALHPHFTLILQALASLFVAWEGLLLCVPEVFVDTTGCPFVYPLAWLAGCKVVCYVHYPTISTDMLDRVKAGTAMYNNGAFVRRSAILSTVKLLYYHLFAAMYGFVGLFPSAVMVNSKWTLDHVRSLWRTGKTATVVYPPVDTETLQRLPIERPVDTPCLISIGQFRPEKNHRLQLEAYAIARRRAVERRSAESNPMLSSKLCIVGSCRNEGDRRRLKELMALSKELGVEGAVEFCENIPFGRLVELLGASVVGLHTMLDEHFGIGIVEYMAAGVIPIAHDSGGPKKDILAADAIRDVGPIGYLRTTAEEYAAAILEVMEMKTSMRMEMAEHCRRRAKMFGQEKFAEGFIAVMDVVLRRG